MITHVGLVTAFTYVTLSKARKIGLFEWYYNSSNWMLISYSQGPLVGITLRLRTWNAQTLMELADCDVGVVPTEFQCLQFPEHLASRLVVAHEGVDFEGLSGLRDERPDRPGCLPHA